MEKQQSGKFARNGVRARVFACLWGVIGSPLVAADDGGVSATIAVSEQTGLVATTSPVTYNSQPQLLTAPVDMVLVKKQERTLSLLSGGVPVRVYPVALGDDPVGHKRFEGDERTPEGEYVLDWRNPESQFYKSIHISYPNQNDIAYAESLGKDPGGMIMIHGWPNQRSSSDALSRLLDEDWTDGCIALTNTAMDEIWHLVENGTPIVIQP